MDVLDKKLKTLEIRINALRLEIIAKDDELARMADAGIDKDNEEFLAKKLKVLSKKFGLAQLRSEKKMLEMAAHSGNEAA